MVVKEIFALLGVKTDPKGVQEANSSVNNLINLAKTAAAAFASIKIGAWIKDAINDVSTLGDQFGKMAARTGTSVEFLQKMEHAAELSGASLSDVETSLKKLQIAQSEASEGTELYLSEFARLGVGIYDINGKLKPTEELFLDLSDGLKELGTDTERTVVATKLLGRGGTTLIPMFKQGSSAVREMMQELEDLGGVIDHDTIKASEGLIDQQSRLAVVLRAGKVLLAREMIPLMTAAAEAIIKWWKANKDWLRDNIVPVLDNLVQIIGNVGKAFSQAIGWIVDTVSNMDDLHQTILGVGVAVTALSALLLSGPIGQFIVLAGLLAVLIDDFVVWREGGESAIGGVVDKLNEMLGIDIESWVNNGIDVFKGYASGVQDAWTGIIGTVLSFVQFFIDVWDDPTRAWNVFLIQLEDAWKDFLGNTDSILVEWALSIRDLFVGVFTSIGESIGAFVQFFIDLWNDPKQTWIDFTNGLKQAWDSWVGVIPGSLTELGKLLAEWATDIYNMITKPFTALSGFISGISGKKIEPPKPVEISYKEKIIPLSKSEKTKTEKPTTEPQKKSVSILAKGLAAISGKDLPQGESFLESVGKKLGLPDLGKVGGKLGMGGAGGKGKGKEKFIELGGLREFLSGDAITSLKTLLETKGTGAELFDQLRAVLEAKGKKGDALNWLRDIVQARGDVLEGLKDLLSEKSPNAEIFEGLREIFKQTRPKDRQGNEITPGFRLVEGGGLVQKKESGSVVNIGDTSVEIHVQGVEGMSEQRVAEETARQTELLLRRQNKELMRALSLAGAGGGKAF